MKLIKGRFRSRKSYKRATGFRLRGNNRVYARRVQTNARGDRFIQMGIRKFLLSHGVR